MTEVELKKLIEHFALSNRSEGKSPKTDTWYTEMLTDSVRWLQQSRKGMTLPEFTVKNVREFKWIEAIAGISHHQQQPV